MRDGPTNVGRQAAEELPRDPCVDCSSTRTDIMEARGASPVSTLAKSNTRTITHPAKPARAPVDIKAAHARIAKRYPKILAKLAE